MTDLPASPSEPDPAHAPAPPAPPGPPTEVSKTPGWKAWAAAGAVAAAVVVGGVIATQHHGSNSPADVQASATPQGQNGAPGAQGFANRGAQGTIASIKGSTLTVTATDRDGATSTVTVTTSSSTTYTDAVAGKVSDLAVGDTVVVRGDVANGAVTATNVTEGASFGRGGVPGGDGAPPTGTGQAPPAGYTPPTGQAGGPGGGGFRGGGFTAGSIVSVNGDAFTVKTAEGTKVVVTTTSATTVTVTKDISFDDLKVGDTVLAVGARTNDTVAATSIRRGEGLGFGRRGTTSTTTGSS